MLHRKSLWLFCLFLLGATTPVLAQQWNPGHAIGSVSGKYNYQYGQTPDQLVEIFPATVSPAGLSYIWQSSPTLKDDDFRVVYNGPQSSYSPPQLLQTTYYRRITVNLSTGAPMVSNTIKLSVVSANWEDRNYIREYDVQVTGITSLQAVEQLPIGQKLQTTTYVDGLGRGVQTISRETATPATPGGLWGDVVQFSEYDDLGRQTKEYLPFTTVTELAKFKTNPVPEHAQYFTNVYNETKPYNEITFETNPLNRQSNEKDAGSKWAASGGFSTEYDMNTTSENVQRFIGDSVKGSAPVRQGVYAANTLYKHTYIDKTEATERKVIEYYNKDGQLILKKIQLDDAPSVAHSGWICTYSVYDDMGRLRYLLQPEAVKYLDTHSWSFAGTEGQQVLNGLCYQFYYDKKGRTTWQKNPGVAPRNMLYDARGRLVFTQDGNQAALSTPQWTANLYDELDRPFITLLYNTNKSIAALQNDIDNAATVSPVTSPNQVTGVDLVINQRQAGITRYVASNSITFISDPNGSFESAAGDEFVAEIDPYVAQPNIATSVAYFNVIPAPDFSNPNVCTIIKYRFYDEYIFASAKPFNTGFTNLSAWSNADPNVIPIAASKRTLNLPTGSMVRVLGSNTFLSTTLYYDEKERVVQSLEDNVKAGTDITTWQYHFDGRVLSRCSDHTTSGTGYSNFIVLSKNNFDKLGRITSVEKQFGSNAFKTVATYDYDDMGRLKAKHLDPAYNIDGKNGLENLNYSYNIHNQITGINKDYALKNPSNYDKWGHFFGMYLGYDNRDNVFSKSRLNGQVTGVLWNTQGDDAQRKYDYTYDNADRLVKADFTEQKRPGEGWSNGKMDFSVNGTSGKITYDLNGNLLSMLQKGVIPGTAAPVTIDDLAYTYESYSNRLQAVTDNTPLNTGSLNGKFGDFKDGGNGTAADYVYDNNGNLVIDLNKNAKELENVVGANGISFNYLDKPEKIRIAGKGTIRIVYNADGDKLQRAFIPETGQPATATTYIDEFVYQQTGSLTTTVAPPFMPTGGELSYINFEEGRLRAVQPVTQNNGLDALQIAGNINLPNGKMGVYDYFIYDYQSNVRMVLTEETHIAANTCTMETSRASTENPVFGQTGAANEVESTRYPKPSAWQNTQVEASVSRLGNIAAHNIGPNTLQKVMAGDKVNATAQYYYQSATGGRNPNFITTVLTSLAQAIAGGGAASDIIKSNVTPIRSQLNGTNGFIDAVQPASDGTTTPQAYLTILFFDERFNFIEAADGGVAQQRVAGSVGSNGAPLGLGNIKAPKNGYAYVYVSNLSDQDVYFDNLQVGIERGNIIEENHYYAYGLKIAAISSRKPGHVNEGNLKNNYQYQGEFSEMDDDIGWNDFEYRSFDVQIGRWLQIDPEDKFTSPYSGMDNDPINNVDPDGADPLPVPFIWKGMEAAGRAAMTTSSVTSTVIRSTVSTVTTTGNILKVTQPVASKVFRGATTTSTFINQNETTYSVGNQGNAQTLDKRFAFQGATARPEVLSQSAINALNRIISELQVKKLTISSTGRKPEEQVRVMFENLEAKQSSTYGPAGQAVISVYHAMKKTGATAAEIKKAMLEKAYKVKPGKVSRHCANPLEENAIDFGIVNLEAQIGTKKMLEMKALLEKLTREEVLSKFLHPGNNPGERAYHIQVLNKTGTLPGRNHSIKPGSNPFSGPAPWNTFSIRPRPPLLH